MTERVCPACRAPLQGNVSSSGECLSCGHDLAATAPPPRWIVGDLDLRQIAKRQRQLLWLVLVVVCVQMATFWLDRAPPPVVYAYLVGFVAINVVVVVSILSLMAALRTSVILRIIVAILLLAPCINLLVLLGINSQATRQLQRAGLKVGLMGVSDEQVVRFLAANRCRKCGYNLVGNTSGICPECGTPVAA